MVEGCLCGCPTPALQYVCKECPILEKAAKALIIGGRLCRAEQRPGTIPSEKWEPKPCEVWPGVGELVKVVEARDGKMICVRDIPAEELTIYLRGHDWYCLLDEYIAAMVRKAAGEIKQAEQAASEPQKG